MLPADTALCCPRTQRCVDCEHSVMLPADTVSCWPRIQRYVDRGHSVMLTANTALCCPRSQCHVVRGRSLMLTVDTALCCPRTQRYVAHGHIWNAKTSCNPLPCKPEIKRRSNFTRFLANYEKGCKNTDMFIHMLIQLSSSTLNFMLPPCTTIVSKFARNT